MELKVKYQYTYFIKPFLIDENKYDKYLLSLLNNKNFKLKLFEKERDFNIYSFFIQNTREYFFPSFSFDKEYIKELEKMSNKKESISLSKMHCNIFEYKLKAKVQGKIENKDGIFFNIDKIEVICFDIGICFILIKTDIDNIENFSDILKFNYRFNDINSSYAKLKDFTNIKIQTDKFSSMDELSDFINNIIGINNDEIELKDMDLYNEKFFVYTYSCIDQSNWNTEDDFKNIQDDFLKYSHLLYDNSTLNFNDEELDNYMQVVEQYRYTRFGLTKQCATLMTSSVDLNNYTKLLFEYENEYLYTLIISLYQRIYIKKIERDIKNNKNIKYIRKQFYKFTSQVWTNEITNSVIGTTLYNKWRSVFELKEIYDELENKCKMMYKQLDIEKENSSNKVILIALIISLTLNIINFIALIKLE